MVKKREVQDLRAILVSEFDNTTGFKIIEQSPKDFIDDDQFAELAGAVMHHFDLKGRPTTVNMFGHTILGMVTEIVDSKYERNAFRFYVGFIFRETADPMTYQSALRLFSETLEAMEKERQFFLAHKDELGEFLPRVLYGLSKRGEVSILLDSANALHLKVMYPPDLDAYQVQDHDVPVLKLDAKGMGFDPNGRLDLACDLALQQVVPHIDGIKSTKKISIFARVDIEVVRKSLRALLYYDRIALVDIFEYSNYYITTEKTPGLERLPGFVRACWEYLHQGRELQPARGLMGLSSQEGSIEGGSHQEHLQHQDLNHQDLQTLNFSFQKDGQPSSELCQVSSERDLRPLERVPVLGRRESFGMSLLRLYCSFEADTSNAIGVCVSRVALMHAGTFDILDVHRLAVVGTMWGVLRRVHAYPTYVPYLHPQPVAPSQGIGQGSALQGRTASSSSLAHSADSFRSKAKRMMDGERTADELCCYFLRPLEELEEAEQAEDRSGVVWRVYK